MIDLLGFILENILYFNETISAMVVGQTAHCSQSISACFAGEVQNTRATFVCLIRIALAFEHFADIMLNIFIDRCVLSNKLLRSPLLLGTEL